MISGEIVTSTASLRRQQFLDTARAAGLELAGVAPALPHEDYSVYYEWLTSGYAGSMTYLTGHRGILRSDPRQLLASAQSILCVGKLYKTKEIPGHTISRYAWGEGDYHDVVRRALERVIAGLTGQWGPFESRICVDTAPFLERSYARAAGLGWIGKNKCLINQPLGSWFFLGSVLVSLEIAPDAPPPDRCGSCRRCIDACPTSALVPSRDGKGWRLDARLCISTWTIEERGTLPEAAREASGPHLFGCDICQEVCPWNRRAPSSEEPAFQPSNAAPWLDELASLSSEAFRRRFRRTPIWRAKRAGLLRNVATAIGNSGEARYVPALRKLAGNADNAVREHARWALERLGARP